MTALPPARFASDPAGPGAPEGGAPENALPSWATRPSRPGGLSDEKLALFIGPRWEPV